MVLILSEQNDLSTTQVMEWLDMMGKKCIRINKEEKIKFEYYGEDIEFVTGNIRFKLSQVKSFWWRRGFFNIEILKSGIPEYEEFKNDENNSLLQYIYYRLEKIHHLDSLKSKMINKLVVSSIARELKILTPKDYIFSNRISLQSLVDGSNKNPITKSIFGNPTLHFADFTIYNYTSELKLSEVTADTFFPSLVQNHIEKKYELRIFYLAGDFYSMAIFSQKDSITKVDFRAYNNDKPNRRVPFKLPVPIAEKLHSLMKKLGLDSGSIDMIVTPENEYVFLEVNPVGQFGMTSFPCNFNIEKRIAKYLSHEN